MELLFVALGGAILGLGAQYALPWRLERGVLVAPAVGVVVASLVWLGLTAMGWAWDGGWIWVVSLVLAGIVAAVVGVLIGRARATSDERMLVRLGG